MHAREADSVAHPERIVGWCRVSPRSFLPSDFAFAPQNVSHVGPLAQKVVPTPDVSDVELEPTDLVLVCCDGLVEKLSNQQVATFVVDQLAAQRKASAEVDPAAIMCALLDFSLQRGSKDNMSSALMLPVPGPNYTRADEYAVGPFSEWASDRAFVDAFFADARKHGHSNEALMDMVNAYNAKQNGNNSSNGVSTAAQNKILVGASDDE